MQKIAISLIALAAFSGAALAERNYDLRDLETVNGQTSDGVFKRASGEDLTDTNAAAIIDVAPSYNDRLTPYERALRNAAENINGGTKSRGQ